MNKISECIGCGEEIVSEKAAVEGLDICRQCLAPRNESTRSILCESYPPLWWGAAMGACLLGAILAGGLIGYPIEFGLRKLGFQFTPFAIAFGAISGVICFAFKLRSVTARLQQHWKRTTMRHFGLPHLPAERFKLAVAMFEPRAPKAKDVRLLAETGDALVFLGRDAAITVIRLSEISSGAWAGFSGAWWRVYELQSKSSIAILIMEDGEMAWGHSTATVELAQRLDKKIHPPK